MPFTTKPPPLPPPTQPFVNPANGLVTGPWYDFLTKLLAWLIKLAAAIP